MKIKHGTRLIGIDPGYGRIGWGIIEYQNNRWMHVAHGCIETTKKIPMPDRLEELYRELGSILVTYKPSIGAVEELFFVKNITTGIQVGQARGVILLVMKRLKMKIYEYTPLEIKQAVTGYGKAEKRQIQMLVQMQLGLKDRPRPDDAADALGVALTCATQLRFPR